MYLKLYILTFYFTRPRVEIIVSKHAFPSDPNPGADRQAYGYGPAFSTPIRFTASPTASYPWDTDAFPHTFADSSAHPFPDGTYRYKR